MESEDIMNDDLRSCGCGCGCGCGNNNGGLFRGLCGGGDTEILFFLVVFLLLFTSFGCCSR